MSGAVAELACDRLIVDLRGNTGGGIGGLRLMSLMGPDRRGVGYSWGVTQPKRPNEGTTPCVRSHPLVEVGRASADRQVRTRRAICCGVHRDPWSCASSRPGSAAGQ